jgi:hypothetical protein
MKKMKWRKGEKRWGRRDNWNVKVVAKACSPSIRWSEEDRKQSWDSLGL